MAEIIGTDNADVLKGTEENDLMKGLDGIDVLISLGGNDVIYSGSGNDDVHGGKGKDTLYGNDDNDQLSGGDGNDRLLGGDGNDLLFGQKGFNTYDGGSGDDTLTGLGELKRSPKFLIFGGDVITDEAPEGIENFIGGSGADRFKLLKAINDDEGRLFVKGQKFAVIRDFTPSEGDKIVLPGSADNYEAYIFGKNNENTAILYRENQYIDRGSSLSGIESIESIDPSLAIYVPDKTALVAVLDGVTAGNMYNSDFYEYTGVYDAGIKVSFPIIVGIIVISFGLVKLGFFNDRKIIDGVKKP